MQRLLLALVLLAPVVATAARADEPCPVAKIAPLALPRVREAVARNEEVTIVAFGSSSTEGWRASNLAHSYPALLQAMLSGGLSSSHVAVLNRGIGGQDVAEEGIRVERDVISVRPTLVIWQLGANGVMRHMPPELFKRLLIAGIHRLQEAKTDVVLMDNQRAPAILASPEHARIDQVMAEIASATGVSLFSRGALMDQWRDQGYPYERFMSDDGVHHNDYGYRCVTETLARAILDGLGRPTASPATVTARR